MGRTKIYREVSEDRIQQVVKQEVRKAVEATTSNEIQQLVKYTIQRDWDIWTVALNDVYGFGRKRLARLKKRLDELYDEYAGELAFDADVGDARLERRVAQIMGG